MAIRVPPGGFAGFSQMTPASRAALTDTEVERQASRTSAGRKRIKAANKRRTKARRRLAKSSGRKMKFGSPAWQKKYKVGKFRA